MSELVLALALAVTIEGSAYALFPDGMKRLMQTVSAQPSSSLRAAGLGLAVAGVGIVWLIKG